MLDRLIEPSPDLLLESCAAGGGRIDHGIFRRTHWAWASDNTDALDRLYIQEGLATCTPRNDDVLGNRRARQPHSTTHPAAVPLPPGHVRSTRSRWRPTVHVGRRSWPRHATLIAEYKEIRPTVQQGDQYRLGTATDDVFGVQYVHGDEVVVFTFARQVRHLLQRRELTLTALDPDASYVDLATGVRLSGGMLMRRGLYLELAGDYVSSLTRLRRVGQRARIGG